MSSYVRLIESVRRTRRTLYLVAGLYIVVGFVVSTATALQGDLLGTFLGFLIISGALSVGMIARTALLVLVRIAHVEESLDGFAARVETIIPLVRNAGEKTNTYQEQPKPDVPPETLLDLANIGAGDPQALAAATLDRDVYPRLLKTMEETNADPEAASAASGHAMPDSSKGPSANGEETPSQSVTTRNLLRLWRDALADEDLPQCRRVLSALIDVTDQESIAPLQQQIRELEDRVITQLRRQFRDHVRRREFADALETGEQIAANFPGRSLATEFDRLRPILTRRAEEASALAPSFT